MRQKDTEKLDPNHTSKSKTVTEEKAQKITDVLNGWNRSRPEFPTLSDSAVGYYMTKKFVLLNYPELKLEDVLCLLAKQRVRIHHVCACPSQSL